ncbi:MAG: hypothetical protein ACQEXE_16530 [Bacillota bacterium]
MKMNEIKELLNENSILKQELIKALDEKEDLVMMCQKLLREKEQINKSYQNLRNSKLGRVTIWMWKRRAKKNGSR